MNRELTSRIKGLLEDAEGRRYEAESLLQLLSELAANESFYSQGLSRLSLRSISPSSALQGVLSSVHRLCNAKAQASQRLSSYLADLIDPLRSLLLTQRTAMKIAERDIGKTAQEFWTQQDQLTTAEDWYKLQLQWSEEFVVQMDQTEGKEERKRLLAEQPEDVNWRMERATTVYRAAVDGYNEVAVKLRDELSSLLAGLYEQEQSRLSLLLAGSAQLQTLTLQCEQELVAHLSEVDAI